MADQPLGRLLLRGVREAQSMILVAILLLLDLPSLLGSQAAYSPQWLGWLWYGLLVAVAAVDVVLGVRHRFWGRAAWPGALFVLAVSTAAAASLPTAELLGPAHYTFGVVGWFGLVIFVDHRVRHVVAFVVLHVAVTAVLLAWRGVLADEAVTLATVALGVGSFQFALMAATLVLRGMADRATEVAVAQAEVATQEAIAREVHADRKARYAALREAALPLLRGIADGALSPSDHVVQRAAAVEAARLRRLFSEHGDGATPLAAEVESLVDVVARRGVQVRYAARPLPVEPPPEVRRSLVEAISGVLLVTARTARVTVGGTGSDVTVSVVTDGDVGGPVRGAPDAEHVRTSTVVDGGRTWVEARWLIP
ncbi:hypothetical protein [Pseudonocardia humida]|uniref:Signal transduction histidine kinase n=1 Tax=Pseudonocardia humida TaxID=2800819 RepID=A0ABT1AAL0_9PSEU|nr:hypothetical protein [Pseudonocardia humida]MCO1659991.1 hypothetical protein [Pseudonocardia humida]